MCNMSEDFVWQFRHLDGDTLGEQKKNLFKLLRKNLFTNQEQLNNTLKNLHPKTHIEHLFYVETLIYFKRTPELVEIVKQGNEVYISRIFKHPWFFKEAFKDIDPSVLVNEFLPCLSFAIRMKVLKWLSVHLKEADMDKIFDCILERYGMRIASSILHACSSTKIVQILSKDDNEIKFKPTQVKILFDKSFSTFQFYLEYHKNVRGALYFNRNVFEHIALKNPVIVLELKENFKFSNYQLGRRTSKKVIGLVKDRIIKNVEDFANIVNKSIIVRQLQGCFANIYLDLFPKKVKDLNHYHICNQLLKFYPKNRRWDLFEHTFSQVFQDINLLDHLGDIDYEFVKLFPNEEIIHKWAEIKYKEGNNSTFLASFEPKKAFSIIKDRINVTTNCYDRRDLLHLMLKCCSRNKDMHLLEKVLKYICTRHRNEPSCTRDSILTCVANMFIMETLSASHWKYIKEMVDVMRIQREKYPDCLEQKYIEFSYKNNKSFKDDLREYVKTKSRNFGVYYLEGPFLLNLENPAVEKELLINMANILPEVVSKEEEFYNKIYEQFVLDVVEFSIKYKKYFINLSKLQNLVEYITDVLNKIENTETVVTSMILYNSNFPESCVVENSRLLEMIIASSIRNDIFPFENVIKDMVTKQKRSDFENKMLQCYFEKILDKHISHDINFWFMKNEPSVIFPFIENILTKYSNSDIWHGINVEMHLKGIKYTRFNFENKLIEIFKEQLNNTEYNRENVIIDFLFHLASTEELVSIVEKKFLPKKQKLDLKDEEMKEIYERQCHVARSLKNVMNPNKMLPIVLNFTVGDYLTSALPSVYSIFYRTPEKDLYEKVDILSGKSVSVRKHAVFLSCELLNINHTVNILNGTNQKNVSSEKHRFSSTLKYFVKNPTHELFDILISNMHVVDKNDTETLKQLTSADIPKKYQVPYIEKCWEFFEDMKEKEVKVFMYLNSLLQVIINSRNQIILSLSPKFCRHVITSYLTKNEDIPHDTEVFTCNVLRYRQSEQLANFDLVFDIIATQKHENKYNRVNKFFKNLHIVASKDLDAFFLKLCNAYWNNLYTPIEKFNEYVSLKLLLLQSTSPEPFTENYAKNVITFFESLVAEYGLLIFQKFRDVLDQHLHGIEAEKRYFLIYNMLKYNSTQLICILVIGIMHKACESDSADINKSFNDTLDILKSVDDAVVKIYYNSKFNERLIKES